MEPLKILKHSSGLLKVYDMGDDFQIVVTKMDIAKRGGFLATHTRIITLKQKDSITALTSLLRMKS